MEKSYQFRIYPNAKQLETIECTFECCRWVYNRALEMRIKAYERRGDTVSCYNLMKMIPLWKKVNPNISKADSVALQQSIRDLEKAYKNFFRNPGKTGFPKFKSKHSSRQSYRTQNLQNKVIVVLDKKHIKLPKLGSVKARISQNVEGRIVNATIKRTPTGKYFVVLCCTDVAQSAIPAGDVDMMGVDAGIHDLAVCSNGERYANPKNLIKAEKKLRREQRKLARKKGARKGETRSANFEKQRKRVARVYEQVANRRKDVLHKTTTSIVRESNVVAVEDLNIEGLKKNRHIAKAVEDASIGELLRQLEYKCAWNGREYIEVSRWFPSSKLCGNCGFVYRDLILKMRTWTCPECGTVHDRDLDAARNIAEEGSRLLKEQNGTGGLSETAA